eukprot:ctg_838.g346
MLADRPAPAGSASRLASNGASCTPLHHAPRQTHASGDDRQSADQDTAGQGRAHRPHPGVLPTAVPSCGGARVRQRPERHPAGAARSAQGVAGRRRPTVSGAHPGDAGGAGPHCSGRAVCRRALRR